MSQPMRNDLFFIVRGVQSVVPAFLSHSELSSDLNCHLKACFEFRSDLQQLLF